MAKTKRKPASKHETLGLKYDLFSLPTAQHKAGLAGLLLMVESMKARKLAPLPEVSDLSATGVKVTFTRDGMRAMMDCLFEGEEITTKKGDKKVVPRLKYLDALGMPEPWVKAWRDCIRSVIRKGAALGIYKRRFDSDRLYDALVTNPGKSEEPDASLIIAGEGKNAERVVMKDSRANSFLLHFTLIPSSLHSPRFVVKDPKTKQWSISDKLNSKRRGPFFVVVVPEPSNLELFVQEARAALGELESAIKEHDYRPASMLVTLPDEAPLEYLYHLTRERTKRHSVADLLSSVEYNLIEKRGDNIRALASGRVLPDEQVLQFYEPMRQECRNPLYRAQRVRNLLQPKARWYDGMQAHFDQYPWEFFISKDGATPRFPFFGTDARRTFGSIDNRLNEYGGDMPTDDATQDDLLARRIYRLIGSFVRQRAEDKSHKKMGTTEYNKAAKDVCRDAFLAMRGRRERDFVSYFAGTICSVPQALPEDDFVAVSRALMADSERVKTLSMLALSAESPFEKQE
jgi:CRISPR-associated protein Cmx8